MDAGAEVSLDYPRQFNYQTIFIYLSGLIYRNYLIITQNN